MVSDAMEVCFIQHRRRGFMLAAPANEILVGLSMMSSERICLGLGAVPSAETMGKSTGKGKAQIFSIRRKGKFVHSSPITK